MKCANCESQVLDDSRFCSNCGTPAASSGDTPTQTMSIGRAAELSSGTMLAGKYGILEVLGRGGMGIVYKAEDTKLHRIVALKFLPPERVSNKESRERFLIEARAAAALSHAHICTIHEIHDTEEPPFIEMEYLLHRFRGGDSGGGGRDTGASLALIADGAAGDRDYRRPAGAGDVCGPGAWVCRFVPG